MLLKIIVHYLYFQLPMGVLFKNENITEDIIDILRSFQLYLPYSSWNGEKKFVSQLCVGDQLSIERAVNAIHSVSNGYTAEDRLEGFNLQLGDWHTGVKILEVKLFNMPFFRIATLKKHFKNSLIIHKGNTKEINV